MQLLHSRRTGLPVKAFSSMTSQRNGFVLFLTWITLAGCASVHAFVNPAQLLWNSIDIPSRNGGVGEKAANNPNNNPLFTASLGNLRVPWIGIGTLAWTSTTTSNSGIGNPDLQSLVDAALSLASNNNKNNTCAEAGSMLLDTAERYGSNWKTALGLGWGETEKLICQLVQQNGVNDDNNNDRLGSVAIATKFTPTPWRTTVQSVVDACDESRRRLGVDQIDLYLLNMPDIVQPLNRLVPGWTQSKDEIYWEGLAECYKRGLVKNVGVCNYGPTLLRQCQDALSRNGGVPLACNQIAYSLLGRHNGAQETVDYCRDNGIRVLAAYPLAMGLLTGKYSSASKTIATQDNSDKDNNSLVSSRKSSIESRDLRGYAEKATPLLRIMEEIALEQKKTVSQIALNYIICKGVIPIPGSRTRQQWEENMGGSGWRLSQEEVGRLENAADQLGFGFDGAGFKRVGEKFVGYGMEKWTLD